MGLDPRKLNPALARPFAVQMQAVLTPASVITQAGIERVPSTHKFVITSFAPVWSRDDVAASTVQDELSSMETLQLRLTERGSNIPILENVTMDAFYDLNGAQTEFDFKIPVVMNTGADMQLELAFTDAGVAYAAIGFNQNKNVGLLLKGHLVAPE